MLFTRESVTQPLKEGGRKFLKVMKKPIPVKASQVQELFLVETLEGTMEGKAGDYIMIGIRGEVYPCDKTIFEESYDILDDSYDILDDSKEEDDSTVIKDFGWALKKLKEGYAVARERGWNGKGMFIYLVEGREQPPSDLRGPGKIHPRIDMKSAQGDIVFGWVASQLDMLGEDWVEAPFVNE